MINKNEGWIVGISKVSNYVYQPVTYEQVSLYDWICLYDKTKKRQVRKNQVGDAADDPDFDESDDKLNI